MSKPKKHLVTSALPYANGPLHIGHIAGAYLPADTYVRFLRMEGEDVAFICGSDEHGAAITLRAKKEGTTPQEIVDKYHTINKRAFAEFGIGFDIYGRTSDATHHKTAADFFQTLYDNGSFDVKTSEQYYDESHDQFLADRYITGTCPKCGNENAYGDQCEKCGSSLSPTELINPVSTLSGNAPILKETRHWYLPMERHEEWLKTWIQTGELDGRYHHDASKWRKHVVGQCMSWLDGGLGPRAMTRDLDWGVKVPLAGAEGKVLYVWLDAPIGYISATKSWAEKTGKNWEDYWKSEDAELTHFIAKDNIVFHCIIFPIILREHGGFNLPVNVPANEFLNLEGQKISTSREWAVWLHEYLEAFPGKQDELRYVLTSISPETKDSEFTWKQYQDRINNELVAILGNFVNRTVVLTHKYYNGVLPEVELSASADLQVLDQLRETPAKIAAAIRNHRYKDALVAAMSLARTGNKYLADMEPWKLVKTDEKRVQEILFVANQLVANMSGLFAPFLPNTASKLAACYGLEGLQWKDYGGILVKGGTQLEQLGLLFSKVEDDQVAAEVARLEATKAAASNAENAGPKQKDDVSFDQFTAMDLRVGVIRDAKPIEKADKLLELSVDVGLDLRTIVSGIAEHFSPEDVVGKSVSVLLNLPPRKLRGVTSQGMILMAENNEGKLDFVAPPKDMPAGSIIS